MKRPARQRGIAAIELALLVPLIFVLLPVPLLLGRVCLNYAVLHKAVHDATRYLSAVAPHELTTPARALQAAAHAQAMIAAATAGTGAAPAEGTIFFWCGAAACGATLANPPATVRIYTTIALSDGIFDAVTQYYLTTPFTLTVDVTMPYVGN